MGAARKLKLLEPPTQTLYWSQATFQNRSIGKSHDNSSNKRENLNFTDTKIQRDTKNGANTPPRDPNPPDKNGWATPLFLMATGLSAVGSGIAHFTDTFGRWNDWAKFGFDFITLIGGTLSLSSVLEPISTNDSSVHHI